MCHYERHLCMLFRRASQTGSFKDDAAHPVTWDTVPSHGPSVSVGFLPHCQSFCFSLDNSEIVVIFEWCVRGCVCMQCAHSVHTVRPFSSFFQHGMQLHCFLHAIVHWRERVAYC